MNTFENGTAEPQFGGPKTAAELGFGGTFQPKGTGAI
jgi:hypothetical protein